ncbi:uncharacterized protein LOC129745328 [Uranotaenia lowii]|uniref:uncharacterized protein LOC129745328 n=1 Tax=Uranotaenia lowii TaxID=190385 RepID=UPI002478CDD0|nr:uncharacterized protein LOC129745328 [Uranotaenia lowii]
MLYCHYDMDGESLYSVKWYKGRREFYRYTPKENPAMKVFQLTGTTVKRSASNETQLMLVGLGVMSSGKYSCEVSADAPSFHTMIVTGDLEVCEVPKHVPFIHGIRQRYRLGDIVRGNCTSAHAKPPANLTWFINEVPANPSHIRVYRPLRDHKTELETALLGLHFVASSHHFLNGKLKIRCSAQIHDIYLQSTEKSIDEERPRVISAASSSSNGNSNGNSINLIHNIPYDQFSQLDNELPHVHGEVSAASAAGSVSPLTVQQYLQRLPSISSPKLLRTGSHGIGGLLAAISLLELATGLLIVFYHLLKFSTITVT